MKRITAPAAWHGCWPARTYTSTHTQKQSRSVYTSSLILVNLIRILFYTSIPSSFFLLLIFSVHLSIFSLCVSRFLFKAQTIPFLHFIRTPPFSLRQLQHSSGLKHLFTFIYFAELSTIAAAKEEKKMKERKETGFSFRFDTSLSSRETN